MKTHTSQFKENISLIGKQLDSKITYELNGVVQTLTSEQLNSITPTFQGAILKSVMKELDLDSNVDIPLGTSINYKFGVLVDNAYEYLDFGNYIVYSSEKQEDTNSYKIICYDKMLNSMKSNEDLGITYPLSVRDYINALCTKIGLEFKNRNDEFANFDRILDKELYVGLDYTYRDIFDELAQVTASTICLDSQDKVEIRYINDLSEFNKVSGNDLIINDGISYPIKKVVVDGKCEQETTTGKNLLPNNATSQTINGINYTINSDGSVYAKGTATARSEFNIYNKRFTLNANTEYKFQSDILMIIQTTTGYISGTKGKTFTSESEISVLRAYIRVENGDTIDKTIYPMITLSNQNDTYEPYTGGQPSPSPDYPQEIKSIKGNITINISSNNEINSITIDLQGNELCSIADIKDELVIDNGNAKIIKRIAKIVLNGSENWQLSSYTNKTILSAYAPIFNYSNGLLISDLFTYQNNVSFATTTEYVAKGGEAVRIGIFKSRLNASTINDFKSWLSEHNTTVYYELKTPEEIDLGQIDKLKTFEGTNNITLEANLKTNMALTYANGWETIDESFLKDVNVNFGEKYGPVNSIVLSRSAESDNVYLQDKKSIAQNGLCEIKIKDNQIMNWNDRSDYLPDILEKLNGLEYYLNDFASTGIAYLDLCDRYNIKVFDNTYSCVMFNDELEVTQGLVENIHTDMPEETETDYTKADKTDRKINNVSLVVDKQGQRIDALAEKVQDISNTIKGSGVITLTDCSKTPLYKLVITGDDNLLFPNSKVYPSVNTFTKNSWLYVNKGESDEQIYDLKIPALRTLGNVKDEYILENTKATLIKRIGLNDNLEKYVLDEPIEIDMGTLTINLKEGTNTLQMPSFPLFSLEATYLLKNDYTDTFASTAYVNSEIEVTSDNILLESKSYTDKATEGDELISRINLDSTGNVKIEASKIIDLTGTDINLTGDNITINSTNFSVDKDGKITSTAGDIAGFEITSNLFEKSINGIYDYNNFDLNLVSQIIMSRIYGDSHIVNILDANNSGGLTASDYMTIKNIMNGTATNNKNVSGYFKIQSDNPKRCLIVTDENGNEVTSIGVGGLNSTYISTNNIVCGYPGNNASDFVGTTINGSTGNITCNSLTQTSLKTHKKDFEKYSNALKELENIDIYKYHLLNEEENSKKHLGFVIGENFNYSEVVTSNDNQGVDNYSFTSLCFQMIKEQQEIINKLEKRVDNLENKLKSVIMDKESDK